MLGDQERAANKGFLLTLERDASKSSVSICCGCCKKIFFDSFLKSSVVGISSLGIHLLLFPGALPVASAELLTFLGPSLRQGAALLFPLAPLCIAVEFFASRFGYASSLLTFVWAMAASVPKIIEAMLQKKKICCNVAP
ncbi:hypothetical protein L1987_48050 [Smallanthus sonchifolius]|uniref:Uncharacterized protein n=3 Tax=Smallanthus sonchifolius TaxID=185202 RepID=A0ACB9FRH2_9ASTR|nr:hypothetical protein L1987_48046 [Smallanthus sonchifolius]KAI3773518.1 hypothetical protein L1987_48048 [Smallanthus sonchifolius]KAI3773520.1 hypothetical protein L1987_48050 [Smallanthus sonchifolius]